MITLILCATFLGDEKANIKAAFHKHQCGMDPFTALGYPKFKLIELTYRECWMIQVNYHCDCGLVTRYSGKIGELVKIKCQHCGKVV